jgi:hypothetical protein
MSSLGVETKFTFPGSLVVPRASIGLQKVDE